MLEDVQEATGRCGRLACSGGVVPAPALLDVDGAGDLVRLSYSWDNAATGHCCCWTWHLASRLQAIVGC